MKSYGGGVLSPHTPSLKLLFFLLLLSCLFIITLINVNAISYEDLPPTEPGEYAITPDGKYAYINTDKAFIMAPAEIHGSGWTYLNFTAKQYTGDIDLAIGFDTTHLKPKRAEFYNPHYDNYTRNYTIYNVTNIDIWNNESIDIGNDYNSIKRVIEYSRPNYNHSECDPEMENNCIPDNYTTETLVVAFDSYTNESNNYTITYHNIQVENWVDITDRFSVLPESIHNNYDGKNKWYYIRDQTIFAGTEYQIRIDVAASPQLGDHTYKYDVVIKPSSQTFALANSNGNLFVLDPYWNTSFSNRKPITITTNGTSTPTDYQVLLNISYESEMQADFDDIRFTNSSNGELSFFLESKVDSSYALVWVNLLDAITDPGSDTIWMYYGNADVSSGSNIEDTMVFGDDFSGDLSKWNTVDAPSIVSNECVLDNDDKIYTTTKWGYGHAYKSMAIANEQDSGFLLLSDGGSTTNNSHGIYNSDAIDANLDTLAARSDKATVRNDEIITDLIDSTAGYVTYEIARISGSVKFYQNDSLFHTETNSSYLPIIDLGIGAWVWDSTQESAVNIKWIFVRKYIVNEPTASYETAQHYSNSLHYNNTDPYNYTIESDGTLTTNRSIIAGDDTSWTANSTGTTYWQFTTAVTPLEHTNFTIYNDILDNFTATNLIVSTLYNLTNSSGIVEAQTTDNIGNVTFEDNLVAGSYWITTEDTDIIEITVTPSTHAVYGHYDADLLSEGAYSTGFTQADIDVYTEMTSTQYTALSTNDDSFVISGGDNQDDGYLYVNFSVPNVSSITSMDITVVGTGDENWYMGAYNYTANKWETMDSTTEITEVTMNYLVEGEEVTYYSQLTDDNATFSIALWESDLASGIVNGDLISIVFNYEPISEGPSYNNVSAEDTITVIDSVYLNKTAYPLNYSINVSDTITISDDVTITKTLASVSYYANLSDTITITDNVAVTKTIAGIEYPVYINDTVTITDSVNVNKTVAPATYEVHEDDIITIADTIKLIKTVAAVFYDLYVSETVTFSDSVSITITVAPIMYDVFEDDIITITDNINVTKILASVTYYANVTDTLTLADTLIITKTVAGVNYSKKEDDTITITDSVELNKTVAPTSYNINISDTINLTDSIELTKTIAQVNYSINETDTVTFSDEISVTKTVTGVDYNITINDTVTYTDEISVIKTVASADYNVSLEDTISINDNVNVSKTIAPINYSIYVGDVISIIDTVGLDKTVASATHNINVTDTISITDNVAVTKTVFGVGHNTSINETITITDNIDVSKTAATVNYSINVSDTLTITDDITTTKTAALVEYSINIDDTILISDNVNITKISALGVNYSINVSDSITISDTSNFDDENHNNFTFTNASVSPMNVLQGHNSVVYIDITDFDGTIDTAIVKIRDINYTMINTVGDTWSYTYSNSYVGKHYITDFYAQDNDSAWNCTTSSLYINVLSSSGSGGGVRPTSTATPTIPPIVTPTPTPIITNETEYNITPTSFTTSKGNTIKTFKFVPWFGDTEIASAISKPGIVECIINDHDMITTCDVYDEVIILTFDVTIDNIYNINTDNITMIDNAGNRHETDVKLSTVMWWPLLIIIGLFYYPIKKYNILNTKFKNLVKKP